MISEDLRNAIQSSSNASVGSSQGTSSSSNVPQIDDVIASVSNDSTVQNAYREEMKSNLTQRRKSDQDFEPEKHPHSSKYFK